LSRLPQALAAVACPLAELDHNEELLQSAFWAAFKGSFGQRPLAFKLTDSTAAGQPAVPVLCLQRSLPGGYALIYVPFGPAWPEEPPRKAEFLVQFVRALRPHLPSGVIFLRCDLPWYQTGEKNLPVPLEPSASGQNRLHQAAMTIQPLSTVLLDIRPGEETLLAGMKHKTRYNIRLAFKKGVQVEEAPPEQLPLWYDLSRETKERDKITIHSLHYYQTLFALTKEYPGVQCKLLLARVESDTVAGIIVLFRGKRAYYLYGASSNRHRNLMPNYALQWTAITLARAAGCESYDFCGIPPVNDPHEAMYGLYQFKTGFGGEIINRYGCYDLVFKPLLYKGFHAAEKLRNFYHRVLVKPKRS
jgi:lipid II:glycine glycyltransferase (peptidoglycan interpeptide bridge formation enzyme)